VIGSLPFRIAVCAACLACAAFPARAARGAPPDSLTGAEALAEPRAARLDSVVVLPEVVVERGRSVGAARRRRPTAFVTELRAGASGRALETMADLLQRAPGVHVVETGGLGAFSTVSLRGAPPGQVGVYLDGMPLQSAARSVVDLAELPMSAVRSVEVYRGGSPLAFGAGRPGGAIHLVTGGAARGMSARVARGSFDTWDARATTGATRGAFSGWVHGGYQGSDGDYVYMNGNGTDFNPNDDVLAERRNNRFDTANGMTRLAWSPAPAWRVRAGAALQRSGRGFPGLGWNPALHARTGLTRGSAHLSLARDLMGGGMLEADASLQRDRRVFEDAEGRLGVGRHRTDDRFRTEQTNQRAESPRWMGASFAAGLALRLERADLHDALDGRPDPPTSVRRTQAAFAEARWQPWDGPLLVTAADRRDRIDDRLHASGAGASLIVTDAARETRSPQAGARIALPRGFEARTNWSRAERVPDFLELFGDGGGVAASPGLAPERVESRDAGLAWAGVLPGGVTAACEWARFDSRGDRFIVYTRQSQSAVQARNLSGANIHGEEFTARAALPFGFGAEGALTWQSAINDGDVPFWRGRRLPQRPEREAYARIDWHGGSFTVFAGARHVSDNYRDNANQHRVPSRTLAGASLGWAPGRGALRFTLEGRNLGDQRVSDIAGYPLPGRSVWFAIDWNSGPDPSAPY
jgi:iron complex outermembrane receptor protein